MRARYAGMALAIAAIAAVVIAPAAQGRVEKPICLTMLAVASTTNCPARPEIGFEATVSPRRLPMRKHAPISLALHSSISTSDGSVPAPLKEVAIALDKNFEIEAGNLPACPRRVLIRRDADPRGLCREAVVGAGSLRVAMGSADLEGLPLTLFNGGARTGVTTLFIRGAAPALTPNPLLLALRLREVENGRYGLEGVVAVPKLAGGNGAVVGLDLEIERHFHLSGGERASFATARCFDGRLQAQLTFEFVDGLITIGKALYPCEARAAPQPQSGSGRFY